MELRLEMKQIKEKIVAMDESVCDCSCHEADKVVLHIVACCIKCPDCNQGIKIPFETNMETHRKHCAKD